MASVFVGYFVVPTSYLHEIAQLSKQWRESLDSLKEIRRLQDRMNECYDAEDWDQGMELGEEADALARTEAEEYVTLEMHGEVSAAEELHKLFGTIAPRTYNEMGAYSAADTRALSRAAKLDPAPRAARPHR